MNAVPPAMHAEHLQLTASDPEVSAFVSAHAGTGKTKLLIDRLMRLMLRGADPAKILCLTFTKAAAAEMAIRLQRRLAGFVILADQDLDQKLKALLVAPTPQARQRARALFAQVLDLPGGMRISTTHAFCQSLLRRFPLEARLSPHFRLVEDQDARLALDEAREAVLPRADPAAIAALAGLVNADGFAALTAQLERRRERLQLALSLPPDALRAALGRAAGARFGSEAETIAAAIAWPGEATLKDALRRAKLSGSPGVSAKCADMEAWLNLPAPERAEYWAQWLGHLFNADGKPTAASKYCNATLAKTHADIGAIVAAEQDRAAAVIQDCQALRCASASASLLLLAAPIMADYAAAKRRGGLVDYDDLIRQTVALLSDGGAAWVKYKLDGGIDHLLLDEVQDSSAVQWDVTDALADDFFSGDGARDPADAPARTVFAVGDTKQSIYSFQGAEPHEFALRRARYRDRIGAAARPWRDTTLEVSFRAAPPLLHAVDAVFADPASAAGVRDVDADPVAHVPCRAGQAGSVVIWPLAPRPEALPATPWTIPDRNQAARSAAEDLVRHLAGWIASQIHGGAMLQSAGRPMRAGDFLVLVQRRGQFDRALVRELKQLGVNVAGLDRMKLTDQLAVQDLVSLCQALLLPNDDLSFAEMLTSPLGGLSDDSLMQLAAGRRGTLWDTLRARAAERTDWRDAAGFFAALLTRVDFASPYALLAEALGPLRGRARLFARLGAEAAEPVDELLAASQAYAADHPPSLQGFLHWLAQSGAEVKREADAGGDVLRIMTVHGAKGLEAPVVILPDTVGLPPDRDTLHWTRDDRTGAAVFLWAPNKALRCAAVEDIRARSAGKRCEEQNRLLYVAMTRARDHLLVCGWQPKHDLPAESWYTQILRGVTGAGAVMEPHEWGQAWRLATAQTAAPDGAEMARPLAGTALPDWAGAAPDWTPRALPTEPALPRPLAPSRPENAAFGAVPAARSPLLRESTDRPASRGSLVHTLLQHLPQIPPAGWLQAAERYAAQAIPEEAASIAGQVCAVLRDPGLAALFGPGSRAEQGLSGVVEGQVMTGRVDRLAVLPDRVIVADYKTSRSPPAAQADTPILYLRQMAAYRALLRLLYPGREIVCVLIWTEGPVTTVLAPGLLDRHAPGVTIRADMTALA